MFTCVGVYMDNYAFWLTSIIIILIPGTGVIYTISTGLIEGKYKSIFAAIGCTLGILPHLVISSSLSTVLLQFNNSMLTIMRLVGAIYLLYLGLGMLFIKNKLAFAASNLGLNNWVIVRRGILINLLNPKLTLFFFSFLPQYLSLERGSYVEQFFLLGCAFMLLTLLVFISYGILAALAKNIFARYPTGIIVLQKGFGLVFIGFALKLALDT